METRQSTHPSPRQLAALALGKLTPEARDRLQAHVSACATCQAFLSQTPPEKLNSLLQQSAQPRNSAEQSTPSAQRQRPTNPALAMLPQARALASEPSPQAPPPADIAPDESIPLELREQTKYRIVRLLGRGGMGSVYEVHHQRMDRRQALKVINPELVDNPQALLRFEQELKAVAKLDHPNIARAYDAETFGSLQAIVMEFVPGQTLHEFLKKRGRLSVKEACRCVRQACLGLQHAHERGLVHRDLKPQNLMLTQDSGIIKILDFGLAKVVSENKAAQGLTKTNMTMGTYEYSAPEQAIDAASADIRADIYSLGCTIYYLIAGVLPFDYHSDAKLLLAHQNEVPRPLGEVCPETPQGLSDLVDRMLAKSPMDRPQTPAEVAKALLPFAKGESAPVSPLPPAVLGSMGEGQGVRAGVDPGLADLFAEVQQDTRHSSPKTKKRPPATKPPVPLLPSWLFDRLPNKPRDRLLVASGAAAFFALVLFGVLFTMRTSDGTLVVEISDPDTTLQVLDAQGKLRIEQKAGAEKVEISVVPGKGRLRVLKNDVELYTKEFTLVSGGRETIYGRLETLPGNRTAERLVGSGRNPPTAAINSPLTGSETEKVVEGPAQGAASRPSVEGVSPNRPRPAAKIKVLIITGDDVAVHQWKETTSALRKILVYSGRFEVAVSEDLTPLDSAATLKAYDVLLLNRFSKAPLSEAAMTNLLDFVRGGKGFFIEHFSSASFPASADFGKLCGRHWVMGKSGHAPRGVFSAKIIDKDHPITAGLTDFQADDELYANLQGDEPIDVLVEGYSDWSKKTEPLVFEHNFGKGRVLHSTLGHDVNAITTPEITTIIIRGVEWAAGAATTTPTPAIAPFDEKKAKEHQEAWSKYLGVPVEVTNVIGMKLVLIPPGEFQMGSPKGLIEEELKRHPDDSWYGGRVLGEGPQHRVRITKPYRLGVTDVTQEEYQRVMGSNPSYFQGDLKRPVEQVSWDDAVEFCRRLSELPKEKSAERRYALPTEAQWEYACRAGTTTCWYSGDDEAGLADVAWFDTNAGAQTHPVGGKKPNAWGLYDMHGNVFEWCQDWYDREYYTSAPTDDPGGPPGGPMREVRGGSWRWPASYCRSAFRDWGPPGYRGNRLGFRVSAVPAPNEGDGTEKAELAKPKGENVGSQREVDLLKLVDPARDAVSGNWSFVDGSLVCEPESDLACIEIPYDPPEEYDYRIVFVSTLAHKGVGQICRGGGKQFNFCIGYWLNTISGFDMIGGRRVNNNPTTAKASHWLVAGQRHVSVAKVRKDGVEGWFDDKLVASYKTDWIDVSLPKAFSLRRPDSIGINVAEEVRVESAKIIEITGEGKRLQH